MLIVLLILYLLYRCLQHRRIIIYCILWRTLAFHSCDQLSAIYRIDLNSNSTAIQKGHVIFAGKNTFQTFIFSSPDNEFFISHQYVFFKFKIHLKIKIHLCPVQRVYKILQTGDTLIHFGIFVHLQPSLWFNSV